MEKKKEKKIVGNYYATKRTCSGHAKAFNTKTEKSCSKSGKDNNTNTRVDGQKEEKKIIGNYSVNKRTS